MEPTLYPLVAYVRIADAEANAALAAWGHYLGPCERPFGRQSFGLYLDGDLVGLAVSASTVSTTVEGYSRYDVVELARLCTAPAGRDRTVHIDPLEVASVRETEDRPAFGGWWRTAVITMKNGEQFRVVDGSRTAARRIAERQAERGPAPARPLEVPAEPGRHEVRDDEDESEEYPGW